MIKQGLAYSIAIAMAVGVITADAQTRPSRTVGTAKSVLADGEGAALGTLLTSDAFLAARKANDVAAMRKMLAPMKIDVTDPAMIPGCPPPLVWDWHLVRIPGTTGWRGWVWQLTCGYPTRYHIEPLGGAVLE